MTVIFIGPQEEEEKFTFIIRSVTGNAAIDQKSSRISITIKKKGYPNGLFGFTGIVMPSRSVNEPGARRNETVRIPVKRNFGRLGDVKVNFEHWIFHFSTSQRPWNFSLLKKIEDMDKIKWTTAQRQLTWPELFNKNAYTLINSFETNSHHWQWQGTKTKKQNSEVSFLFTGPLEYNWSKWRRSSHTWSLFRPITNHRIQRRPIRFVHWYPRDQRWCSGIERDVWGSFVERGSRWRNWWE